MTPPPDAPVPAEALLAEAGWLRSLARSLARDAASADDLAQGALAVALANPPKGGRPLRPWLAGVVRNLARRWKRADARRVAREHAVSREESIGPEGALLEQFEEQQRIARLLNDLEPELRVLVLRRFWRGESAADIARATGAKPVTVRAQLARAIGKLRDAHRRELGERRSLAALGIAGIPGLGTKLLSLLAPILAMKTVAKLAAVAAVVLVAVWGSRAFQEGRADAGVSGPGDDVTEIRPATTPATVADPETSEPERTSLVASVPRQKAAPIAEPTPAPPAVGLRVVDEAGRPIEGARLVFVHRSGRPRDLPASDRSGPDGRLAVEIPREATFGFVGQEQRLAPIKIEAAGYAASFFVEGVAKEGLEEIGDRVLRPGSSVAGVVLDERGEPAPDVHVAVRGVHAKRTLPQGTFSMRAQPDAPSDDEATLRTVTADGGTFELEGVQTGSQEFWFRKTGSPWHTSEPYESVAGSRRTDVVLRLPAIDPARVVRGVVLDPDGGPVSAAKVRYQGGGGWGFWSDERLPVDAQGRFELVTRPGASVSFAAFADDDAFGPSPTVAGAAGGPDVVLRLTPARFLRVVVSEKGGGPIEKAWLLPRMGVVEREEGPMTMSGENGDSQGRNFARTDEEGVCELLAPSASFQLRVGHRACESLDLGPFDPLALPEELVVELERDPELVGVVRANGKPVAGAKVFLMESWGDAREKHKGFSSRLTEVYGEDTVTDATGTFRRPVDELREYPLTLLVEAEGYARHERTLGVLTSVEQAGVIEIDLTSGGRLEGEVTVPSGRSPLGVVIGISREDGRPLFTRTDADGRYSFDHLTAGPWRLEDRRNEPEGASMQVLQPGEEPFEPNLEIREGVTTTFDVDLRWQADVRVHGRLTIDGEAPEGWVALVETDEDVDDGEGFRPVALDASGRFAAPAAPGPAVLLLKKEVGDVRWTFRRELVVDAELQPLEIALRTATVEAEDREANEAFRVRAKDEALGEVTQWFEADADGVLRASVVCMPFCGIERPRKEGEPRGGQWAMIERLELSPGETHVVTER